MGKFEGVLYDCVFPFCVPFLRSLKERPALAAFFERKRPFPSWAGLRCVCFCFSPLFSLFKEQLFDRFV